MVIALIVIGLILAAYLETLLIISIKRTSKFRKLKREDFEYDQEQLLDYAQLLQKMIQCKTVSVKDSYDDTEFEKLRNVMQELFPRVHERAERMTFGDDCWMFKINGIDQSRNIMLMSHHDVVPAQGEWKYDPFSGEIAEGKIWGRGTVDTKTSLFAQFAALEGLLEDGFIPACNLYLGSSHNEEIYGDGMPLAHKYFKEKGITFEVILDEGGALIDAPLPGMKAKKCAMVAIHERGRYRLLCNASVPQSHTSLAAATMTPPVQRMASFVHEASSRKLFIRKLNPQVKAMFAHLAPYCTFPLNVVLSNIWLFGGIVKSIIPKLNPQAAAMIGSTGGFTELNSPDPNTCTATYMLRGVNELDMQRDLQQLRAIAARNSVSIAVAEDSEYHAPADIKKPQFAYTMDCIGKCFPQYPAAPFILPAGTDARTFTDICPCVLRFAPITLSKQQFASVHSENENIDLESIVDAVYFYQRFIENYR